MKDETAEQQPEEQDTVIPAVRAPEPVPAEPEPVQTPTPNSGAIVEHLKSVTHSVLGSIEATGKTNQDRLEAAERSFHSRFDSLVEKIDTQHREAVRGIALTVAGEIEQVKVDVRELVSEVRSLARLFTLSKGEQ